MKVNEDEVDAEYGMEPKECNYFHVSPQFSGPPGGWGELWSPQLFGRLARGLMNGQILNHSEEKWKFQIGRRRKTKGRIKNFPALENRNSTGATRMTKFGLTRSGLQSINL